jgi:hypothetical protein
MSEAVGYLFDGLAFLFPNGFLDFSILLAGNDGGWVLFEPAFVEGYGEAHRINWVGEIFYEMKKKNRQPTRMTAQME